MYQEHGRLLEVEENTTAAAEMTENEVATATATVEPQEDTIKIQEENEDTMLEELSHSDNFDRTEAGNAE